MTDTVSAQPPAALYPPTVRAPEVPLPLWRFLPTFVRNPLRAIPTAVYHEPIVVPSPLRGHMAWITDPSLVEEVLLGKHDEFPKSPIEKRIFEAIIGDGILTAEGPAWRWQRRIAAPLFRHSELMSLVPQMAAAGERMVERWRGGRNGNVRAIDQDMTDVTFDLLQSTIFAGATEEEAHIMKDAIGSYLEWTSWDIAYEVVRLPSWVWHPGKRPMRHAARSLTDNMLGIVARERVKGWPGGSLMAQLGNARDPESGEPMSDPQLAHNLLTFAAAGHETTAKALTWALYLLARAPEWQQRLHDEATSVLGSATVGREHVDRLVLARQVIKETMRLYPPAPVMGRMAREDVMLGGHRFAKGAMIVIPIYVIHRHRKLWDDPDRFDPTRFEPTRESHHARTQFMPFGFGPRTCIGVSFAMIEAVVLLATFMRDARVVWDGVHAPEPVSRVTLRAKGGMPLAVEMITR